jgi:hypothetical protein
VRLYAVGTVNLRSVPQTQTANGTDPTPDRESTNFGSLARSIAFMRRPLVADPLAGDYLWSHKSILVANGEKTPPKSRAEIRGADRPPQMYALRGWRITPFL